MLAVTHSEQSKGVPWRDYCMRPDDENNEAKVPPSSKINFTYFANHA